MEPGGSIPHSQGLSNNPYPESNQPNSLYRYLFHYNILLPSTVYLRLPKDLFTVDLKKIKSVALSFKGSHTCQLDFCI